MVRHSLHLLRCNYWRFLDSARLSTIWLVVTEHHSAKDAMARSLFNLSLPSFTSIEHKQLAWPANMASFVNLVRERFVSLITHGYIKINVSFGLYFF